MAAGRSAPFLILQMTAKPILQASRWATPFEGTSPYRLHLLRVTSPTIDAITYADGRHFDFSEFLDERDCEILIFNEPDQTVYKVLADADAVLFYDEREFPRIDERTDDCGSSSFRLMGSRLQQSESNYMMGGGPAFCVITGWGCVEFICLNEPLVEAVGTVEDSRQSFN